MTELTISEKIDFFPGEGRRICSAEQTVERIMPYAPVMGITRLANITGLDIIGIPVYTAHRPNARSLSVTQGKGVTHAAAKASALMEAVETYHAETISKNLQLNSYIELRCQKKVVDVSRLSKFKDSEFNLHSRILWIEGHDVFSNETKLVPYESVHVDYRAPLPSGHGCFLPSSNGLASGNNIQEALIHAICEIIERDALTLWQLKPLHEQNKDKVLISTIDDPICNQILGRFKDANLEIGIWDITSDIGIPSFLCRILPHESSDITLMRPSAGMGCHLNRNIALRRALTEAAQSRLTFISGVRDDLTREDYNTFLRGDVYEQWHAIVTHKEDKAFTKIFSLTNDKLSDDLQFLLQRLRANKIDEVIVVDLTKPELNIPVVRVIIPGLEATLFKSETILGQRASLVLTESQRA